MSEYFPEFDEATEGSDDYHVDPKDFADIFVIPSDWTVSTLRQEMPDIIDLDPDFQRRSVWSKVAKSKFIESLILGIPIPQILLAESKVRKAHYLVLDGKQRLLTIHEFFNGSFSNGEPFKLRGLDDLTELNGKDWQEISAIFPQEARHIEGAQIRTAIIRGWRDDNVLYEIFHRLNSGSVRLSPMELRMALIRGPFIQHVIRRTADSPLIQNALRLREPDKRMKDVEITIRHMAFEDDRISYQGNLKTFLDGYCKLQNNDYDEDRIENEIAQLEAAIEIGLRIFERREFCSKYDTKLERFEGRFNRAIFDILSGALRNRDMQKAVKGHDEKFKNLFKKICADNDFIRSIETTTKSIEATSARFEIWYKALEKEFGVKIPLPNIGNG